MKQISSGVFIFGSFFLALGVLSCSPAPTPSVEEITEGRFDPRRVYVIGFMPKGGNTGEIVALPEAPEFIAAGFSGTLSGLTMSAEGHLVYDSGTKGLRIFEADPPKLTAAGEWIYPENPRENDLPLETPECVINPPDDRVGISNFWIDPGGRIAYRCSQMGASLHFVDGKTVVLRASGPLLALGTKGRALVRNAGKLWVVDAKRMAEVQLGDKKRGQGIAVRADSSGFLMAVAIKGTDPRARRPGHLLRLSYQGEVSQLGDYGEPPDEVDLRSQYFRLDAAGTLYGFGEVRDSNSERRDVVVAFPIEAQAEVVFTESPDTFELRIPKFVR